MRLGVHATDRLLSGVYLDTDGGTGMHEAAVGRRASARPSSGSWSRCSATPTRAAAPKPWSP